eukprot:TRINITY_DN45601_c0_g1_i1.p1 TRINITY_DN45601_c0_g1~~TRINITY_DN45601_c0_g1_i1.p1  ORF type:complete len:298 (+),score=45.89 TRINITY_DN45601_c0_g1_i1:50-943(+)
MATQLGEGQCPAILGSEPHQLQEQGEKTDPELENQMRVDLEAIDALFRDGLRCKLCELYTLVYDMATHRGMLDYSATLYDMYRRRMVEAQTKLECVFSQLLVQAHDKLEPPEQWLERVVSFLEGQARYAHIFVHGFEYLDRYYVKGDSKKNIPAKPTLQEMSYMCYEEMGLRELARLLKVAFTDAVCEMAEGRKGAASWTIVRSFAFSWRRLFGCLLGPDWEEEYDMHSLLEQHRHASLVGFSTAAPLESLESPGKSIWTPQLVGMIMEYISDAEELHAAYGVKSAGCKSRPIIQMS